MEFHYNQEERKKWYPYTLLKPRNPDRWFNEQKMDDLLNEKLLIQKELERQELDWMGEHNLFMWELNKGLISTFYSKDTINLNEKLYFQIYNKKFKK